MSAEERVLVIGAGPVGLVAALRLAHLGIPSTLVEQEPELPQDLRASTFHPPTLEMLELDGITAEMHANGLVCPSWQVRMHATGERAEFDLSILKDDTRYPYRLQCEQSKLAQYLLDRVRRRPEVSLRFGCKAVAVAQDEAGVSVTVEDAGGGETLTGRFLIGADGARSVVRRTLGFDFDGAPYPETVLLTTTTFPFHEHMPNLSNVSYCWTENGTFSLLRLPDRWRCSLYPDAGETIEQALEPDAIERKLQRIVPKPGRYEVMEKRPYRIHQRIASDYRKGRIAIAGDAAHLNSPSGGMGLNGGIHDAFNLTGKIATIWRGEAGLDLLDRYTRQRRPIAHEEIIQQADRNRARMQERDQTRRREILAGLQALAADPVRCRQHLLRTSMIEGLRKSAAIQ